MAHALPRRRLVALAVVWALGAFSVEAADYPNRPIHVVVPWPPGGPTDAVARVLSQEISETLRQPVVIDNKAGATGVLGSDFVAKAAPDGYTLLMGVIGPLSVLPHLVKMQYDPVKDLAPIGMLATVANIAVVR